MIQLPAMPNTIEMPSRIEVEPQRVESDRLDLDRPFSRELNEAESRYGRARPDAADQSVSSKESTDVVSESANEIVATDEIESSSEEQEAVARDSASQDSDQADESDADDAAALIQDGGDAAVAVPVSDTDEPIETASTESRDTTVVEPIEAVILDDEQTQITAIEAGIEPATAQVVAVAAQATVKAEQSGQGLADRSQVMSGKNVDTTVVPGAIAATTEAQDADTAETSGDQSRGDSTKHQSSGPALPTAPATQTTTTDAVTRPGAVTSAVPPTPVITLGTSGAPTTLAQTLAATTPESDADPVNTARLTRGLQSALQQPGGTVTLRLTPPELGTVRIQLQLASGTVSASLQAESASARTMLTQQLSQLRTALESQGLNVERLNVQPMQQTSQSSLQQQSQQSTPDGRSRGQYTGQQQQSRDDQTNPDQSARESFERLMLNEVA